MPEAPRPAPTSSRGSQAVQTLRELASSPVHPESPPGCAAICQQCHAEGPQLSGAPWEAPLAQAWGHSSEPEGTRELCRLLGRQVSLLTPAFGRFP